MIKVGAEYSDFSGAQTLKHLPAMRETWVGSLGQEGPLEEEMATHSSILAGESHEQRSLGRYSPWGRKESDATEGLSTRTQDGYFPPQPSPGFLQS